MEDLPLPEDMCLKILERLSIRDILNCRRVCKSWRDRIKCDGFVKSYTPEPGLAFTHRDTGYIVVTDEACRTLFRFDLPPDNHVSSHAVIDSTNGLILVWELNETLFICNPITREYVQLPPVPTLTSVYIYGFGVSKISRQYKILCGTKDSSSCYVYSLERGETGLWRSIASKAPGIPIFPSDIAKYLNGSLHWLVSDSKDKFSVCCLDLETELFTEFSLPYRDYGGDNNYEYHMCILKDRLCFCDALDCHLGVNIWWMDSYGDAKSWVKAYSFHRFEVYPSIYGVVYPLRVFVDDDLLFATTSQLFLYSKRRKWLVAYGLLERSIVFYPNIVIYTPSFLSLTTMGIHNVQLL